MIVKCIWYVTILFANRWLCTCTLRINITVPPVGRYGGKKAETWGPSWQHGGLLNRVDVLEAGRANTRRLLRRPPFAVPHPSFLLTDPQAGATAAHGISVPHAGSTPDRSAQKS